MVPPSPALSVDRLSKVYRLYDTPADRVKEWLSLGALRRGRDLNVLDEVSFSLAPGRSLGIVGPNGAGKSTLLKILAGTIQPSSGSFAVRGRLTAMLELGAGFHPDFTGMENLRMNALLMGLSSRETREILPRLAEFSELGDFLHQPVRTYSSGMYVRLGFSLAAGIDPDILIVDEALSVGDEHFRHKSQARMDALRREGRTLMFVSHDFAAVRELCDEAIFLERGHIVAHGPVEEVTLNYLNRVHFMEEEARYTINRRSLDNAGLRFGTGEIVLETVKLLPTEGEGLLRPGCPATLRLAFRVHRRVGPVNFGFNIFRDDGVHCVGTNQVWSRSERLAEADLPAEGETGIMQWRFDPLLLLPGGYSLSVNIYQDREGRPMPLDEVLHVVRFRVERGLGEGPLGVYLQPGRWEYRR